MASRTGPGSSAAGNAVSAAVQAPARIDTLAYVSHRPSAPGPVPAGKLGTRKDLLLSSVLSAVTRRLESVSEDDLALIDPDQLAARAAALIPTPHPFVQLGPFYTTRSVTKWLGITRQALDQRVRARKMLGCPTADGGQRVYPVWQFTDDGRPIPQLAEVLDTLRQAIDDPWTWATWLAAPVPECLEGMPAYRWLAEGRNPEPVLVEARRTASRLAQ